MMDKLKQIINQKLENARQDYMNKCYCKDKDTDKIRVRGHMQMY